MSVCLLGSKNMQEKELVEQTTCFNEHKKRSLCCKKESCRLCQKTL